MLLTLFAYNLLTSGMLNIKVVFITEKIQNINWVEYKILKTHLYDLQLIFKEFCLCRFRFLTDLNVF